MKLVHIITGLSTGGAEMMLFKLLSKIDRDTFNVKVVSLTDIGPIGQMIESLGIPVFALEMRRGIPDLRALFKLVAWLRNENPDLVQTWMYHSDLMGGLAAILAGGIPVIWNIRHSNLDPTENKRSTVLIAKTCAKLAHAFSNRIICCSEVSRQIHKTLGYYAKDMVVIPNGFDVEAFKPDPLAKFFLCEELGIPEDSMIIGVVARFDPQKDHHNFIMAAAKLKQRHSNVQFVLCGEGITTDNNQLLTWINQAGSEYCFHLLGRRLDISRLTAAFDIASLSSFGEGFPNVIGEAMACGIPCVVTDAGDSAYIVGDTGLVVPARNPDALAQALTELINMGEGKRIELGKRARARVMANFELSRVVKRYEEIYQEVLKH